MASPTTDRNRLLTRVARVREESVQLTDEARRECERAQALTELARGARTERWQSRYEQAVVRQDELLRGVGLDLD